MAVICKKCGGPHPVWECNASPAKIAAYQKSTAARKGVPSGAVAPKKAAAAGTQAPPVDLTPGERLIAAAKTAAEIVRKRGPGRPKSIPDMKAYKRDKAKARRDAAKAAKAAKP